MTSRARMLAACATTTTALAAAGCGGGGGTEGLADFARFTLENEQTIAEEARFVPLSQEQIDEQLQKLENATA